jgi:predicted histidine transporter YuiF (NhaC family)
MLKQAVLVLVVTVLLLVAAAAAAVTGGKAGSPGGDIGLGPTQLLADGTLEPDLA